MLDKKTFLNDIYMTDPVLSLFQSYLSDASTKDENIWYNQIVPQTDKSQPNQITTNRRKESAILQKKPPYQKDCKNCRQFTKTCLYTCKQKLPFFHYANSDSYMEQYRENCSSVAKNKLKLNADEKRLTYHAPLIFIGTPPIALNQ